ncbi:MAG: hypothetical protein WBD63_12465 [Phycisphaerae bacterium]|nr:hypothetical protein [Phycisphaerae bacterium]
MKSTRRHELQTNELADWIGRNIQWLKPHARLLGWSAAVVLLAVFVFVVLPRIHGGPGPEALAVMAFNQTMAVPGADSLREFLKAYPDSPQAPTARLALGDRLLGDVATGLDAENEADAQAKRDRLLAEARDLYAQAAEAGGEQEGLARVGLAMILLAQGRLEEGREALEAIRKDRPNSLAAAKAKAHLEALAGYEPITFSDEPLAKPEPAGEGKEPSAPEPEAEGKADDAASDAKPEG